MLVFKEGFLDLIDENDDNEIPEKTFLDFCLEVDTKDQDVYQDDYQIHRFHELSRIHFWAVLDSFVDFRFELTVTGTSLIS